MLRLGELAYWINERERVRQRKERGCEPPWTDNVIIANTRFCNVRREDDKVTRWIRQNWGRFVHHENYTVMMALARYINWIPTLEKLPDPEVWDPDLLKENLHRWMDQGFQVFGPAYIVSTNGRAMSKIDYVVDHVLTPLQKNQPLQPWDEGSIRLSTAHTWLTKQQGIGSFMSGQIIADLKNTAGHPLAHAPDWMTWCCPGPGSKRGLNRLYGHDKDEPMSEKRFHALISPLRDLLRPLLDLGVFADPDLSMQDIQNCLCEFDKFIRVKEGGRAKSGYRAG